MSQARYLETEVLPESFVDTVLYGGVTGTEMLRASRKKIHRLG